jgi:hypothetical protein
MMKQTLFACGIALASAATLGAQTSETTTKTKVHVKDGKHVSITGCVESGSTGEYLLTRVANNDGTSRQYVLVSGSNDFSKHVGHRVRIDGTAADGRHGKVKISSETKVDGVDKDTHEKLETRGDMSSMPFLGVKHMKVLATSCF